jgi:hypothetical protein
LLSEDFIRSPYAAEALQALLEWRDGSQIKLLPVLCGSSLTWSTVEQMIAQCTAAGTAGDGDDRQLCWAYDLEALQGCAIPKVSTSALPHMHFSTCVTCPVHIASSALQQQRILIEPGL